MSVHFGGRGPGHIARIARVFYNGWLLIANIWRDNGVWDDSESWKD